MSHEYVKILSKAEFKIFLPQNLSPLATFSERFIWQICVLGYEARAWLLPEVLAPSPVLSTFQHLRSLTSTIEFPSNLSPALHPTAVVMQVYIFDKCCACWRNGVLDSYNLSLATRSILLVHYSLGAQGVLLKKQAHSRQLLCLNPFYSSPSAWTPCSWLSASYVRPPWFTRRLHFPRFSSYQWTRCAPRRGQMQLLAFDHLCYLSHAFFFHVRWRL